MSYDPHKHHRKSIRLPEYDYSQPNEYFITICVQNRECLLGEITNGKNNLSAIGNAADMFWKEIPNHFPDALLDEYVIMPNHLHGIIEITAPNVGVQNFEPLRNQFRHIIPHSIGSIIRGFKIGLTKWCKQNGYEHFKWQRNYYDHIIRNKKDEHNARQYIIDNPMRWDNDEENPYKLS